MSNSIAEQRFEEYVRQGWDSSPEGLSALQNGEITSLSQAKAYFDVDETEGLSIAEAKDVIDEALESPEY